MVIAILGFLLVLVLVWRIYPFLLDYKISEKGIQIILVKKISLYTIYFKEIADVLTELPRNTFWIFPVNIRNRFPGKALWIRKNTGPIRYIAITPKDVEQFRETILARIPIPKGTTPHFDKASNHWILAGKPIEAGNTVEILEKGQWLKRKIGKEHSGLYHLEPASEPLDTFEMRWPQNQ